jgi:enterochelin esterase-like enzyme
MQEIIMVAVDCSPQRYQEYRGPSYSTDTPPSPTNYFHRYSDFLIKELKPRIDREYRTLTNAENTAIMGSSLGGICSLTLAWEHPEVFGKAASLSGSYQIEKRDFLVNGLQKYQGKPKPVLVYLDSGVTDFMGGDDGRANTEQVAAELRRIGWVENKNLQLFIDAHPLDSKALEQSGLRKDKWAEAQKSQHNEFYWRLRAWRPLTFLFPPIEKP